jgi:DNA-binding XRE family transcriptional regulator
MHELIFVETDNPFPIKLKEVRWRRGMLRPDLAKKLDRTPTQIYRYEMKCALKAQMPTLEVFRNLCVVLQVDPKELLGLAWKCGETIKDYRIERPDSNGDKIFHWKCPNCSLRNIAFGEEIFGSRGKLLRNIELQCDDCGFIFTRIYEK